MDKVIYFEDLNKDDLSELGNEYISEGCINLGVNLLYRAVKDKSEQAVITLASFLISGEDYIQAINVLNEGLTFAVNKHEIYLLLAHCYGNLKEYKLSEFFCAKLLSEKRGKTLELNIPELIEYGAENQIADSGFFLLPKKHERETDNKLNDASLLYKKGEYDQCLHLLETIDNTYNLSRQINLKLMCYVMQGKNNCAYECAKKYFESNKEDLTSLGFLICFAENENERNNYKNCLLNFKVKNDEDYYRAATIALECGLYEFALENFELALDVEGLDYELYLLAASAAAGAKKYSLALEYAEMAKYLDNKAEFQAAVLMNKIKNELKGKENLYPSYSLMAPEETNYYKNELLFLIDSGNFSAKTFKDGSLKLKQLNWLLNNYAAEDLLVIAKLSDGLSLKELIRIFKDRLTAYEVEDEQKIYILANLIIKNKTFACYFFSKEANMSKLMYKPLPENLMSVSFSISVAILLVMGASFCDIKENAEKINKLVEKFSVDNSYAGILLIMKYAKPSLVKKFCNEFMLDFKKASEYYESFKTCDIL